MQPSDFRRLALDMPDAVEGAHMQHPDFRVNGRVFATLKPGGKSGMVKLPLDDQRRFVARDDGAFAPESGAWGRQGCTSVSLAAVDEATLREAITRAWQCAVDTRPVKRRPTKRRPPA
jgi:hypothetical protein